jgi:hypothetical protein
MPRLQVPAAGSCRGSRLRTTPYDRQATGFGQVSAVGWCARVSPHVRRRLTEIEALTLLLLRQMKVLATVPKVR